MKAIAEITDKRVASKMLALPCEKVGRPIYPSACSDCGAQGSTRPDPNLTSLVAAALRVKLQSVVSLLASSPHTLEWRYTRRRVCAGP